MPKIEEEIHNIAYKIGSEGLGYWLLNYSSNLNSGDSELDALAAKAREAISAFEGHLEDLMGEHDAEYG